MATGPNDFAERAASAFNRHDVEAMLALFCEDFIYLDSMGIQTGREAMRKRENALLEALPDAHVIFSPFAASHDRLALTAFLTGTFAAPLVLPDRVIPPHGRHITAYYAAHFTFKDGLVIREEAFFDSAVLLPLTHPAEG
ncbi:nuclear transport factor 2 family protein [Pseudomonas sp. MG-9]|uniref:Nuclear transport factor 2 family protein n=1 Tax=Pseudomonas serboccidentalis TaxID=2964670 RepID=A0ABY7Z3S3_9PSED|nr:MULTISPECIES: nuclear transport factor 2 family protein [Pseudomonas]MBT9268113.1 nuclear transport factor 2 family protein [Pseudomonas sp. MG-9]WDR34306.1 nuclear transport factor 2 family protein [Pseudomonas serboccidentalis]